MQDPTYILAAEHVGTAKARDGKLNIGGLEVPWTAGDNVDVYVRRSSADLSIFEIHMAPHDGLANEQLEQQNEEAAHHPLGAKEYWRREMVGRYRFGSDQHLMTNAEFEAEWHDDDE